MSTDPPGGDPVVPTGVGAWLAGARPRTLPASVVPVLVGTAVASSHDEVIWWRALAAGVVALSLQVATNYANDYSDGIRGADDTRVGPLRLVASGVASPSQVRAAALMAFAVAAVAGLALAAAAGWELLIVGAVSIAAGWFYTGGPRPYGYAGFGELFVFVFFGLVATVGSAYVQLESITALMWVSAVPVGLLSVALLVVNNLRDIPSDAEAGKRTLAVRMGAPLTRGLYVELLVLVFLLIVLIGLGPDSIRRPWALIALAGALLAVKPIRVVRSGATGPALIPVLGATGGLQLVTGVLLATGIALG